MKENRYTHTPGSLTNHASPGQFFMGAKLFRLDPIKIVLDKKNLSWLFVKL